MITIQFSTKKVGSLPSFQLVWFLASIYLDPGFEPLISQRWVPRFYPSGHRVDQFSILMCRAQPHLFTLYLPISIRKLRKVPVRKYSQYSYGIIG